jgi:hypothetical protein
MALSRSPGWVLLSRKPLAPARSSIARDPGLNAALSLSTAVVAGLLVTAAALVIAVRRLASFSLKGEPA